MAIRVNVIRERERGCRERNRRAEDVAVTVKRTFYCDAEGCDSHASSDFPGWLILSDRETARLHFCNADCLFKWAAAHSEPPMIIPLGGGDES